MNHRFPKKTALGILLLSVGALVILKLLEKEETDDERGQVFGPVSSEFKK